MQALIRTLLKELGEDPEREGLRKTPERVARSLAALTSGTHENPAALIRDAIFTDPQYRDLVVVNHIPFYSLCEHHMLPFFGEVHVAYHPDGRLVGLSKIPRVVDCCARRLQMQERLTQQIVETLQGTLHPQGVAVVVRAQHLCMQMRGVQKSGSHMTTSALTGTFKTDPAIREEFFTSLRG